MNSELHFKLKLKMLCSKGETDNLGYVCIKQQSRAKSLMVLIYSTKLKIKIG